MPSYLNLFPLETGMTESNYLIVNIEKCKIKRFLIFTIKIMTFAPDRNLMKKNLYGTIDVARAFRQSDDSYRQKYDGIAFMFVLMRHSIFTEGRGGPASQ